MNQIINNIWGIKLISPYTENRYSELSILLTRIMSALAEKSAELKWDIHLYVSNKYYEFTIVDKKAINIVWFIDDFEKYSARYIDKFDYIFTTASDYRWINVELAASNINILPVDRDCDISVFASADNDNEVLNLLKKLPNTQIYGVANFEGSLFVSDVDLASIISRSKICVVLNSQSQLAIGALNMYCFDAVAYGAVLLTNIRHYRGLLSKCIVNIDKSNIINEIDKLLASDIILKSKLMHNQHILGKVRWAYRINQIVDIVNKL